MHKSIEMEQIKGVIKNGEHTLDFVFDGKILHLGEFDLNFAFSLVDLIAKAVESPDGEGATVEAAATDVEVAEAPKKKRGRPKKSVASPAPESADAEEPESTTSDVPEEILKARQLKQLVGYFLDAGHTTAEAIHAECMKYTDVAPLLKKPTANLMERISRCLVLLGADNES